MSDGSPPQRPPQISPDGKWVWDGTEWQPVAGRDSGHTGVFPAFSSAARVDPGYSTQAQPAPMPFPGPPPAVNYAPSYANPQTNAAPLWQVKPGHWNKYLYVVAGIVVLVIAGIFLNSLGPVYLPWSGGTAQPTPPVAGPSLLATRSDSAAANRFLSVDFGPAITSLNKSVSAQSLSCNGVLTVGCQAALVATDDQVKNALTVTSTTSAPVCIAPNASKIAFDLTGLAAFLKNAFQAYTDSSKGELVSALAGFYYADRTLQLDFIAAVKAQASFCDTQPTGP